MGKTYTHPLASHPKWLPFLKPLLSGVFTADNMDYVLRDAAHIGVAQDVVHVVGGEDAREGRVQGRGPLRGRIERGGVPLAHQIADPRGVGGLAGVEIGRAWGR